MPLVRMLCATALAFHVSGCLFVQNGRTEAVQFQSNPTSAQVVVNGVPRGATPTTVVLSRCENYSVSVDKPGYTPVSVILSRTFSGPDSVIYFFDSLLLLPALADLWYCSQNSLKPNPVSVQLSPATAASTAPVPEQSSVAPAPISE
ncbi:MAG: PEGA domain-containing protein [Candidatus Binataceae bacterium]